MSKTNTEEMEIKEKALRCVLERLVESSRKHLNSYWTPIRVWLNLDENYLKSQGLRSYNEGGVRTWVTEGVSVTEGEGNEKYPIEDILERLTERRDVKKIFFYSFGSSDPSPAYRAILRKKIRVKG